MLAFYETVRNGLVAVEILGREAQPGDPIGTMKLKVKVTATRHRVYKRGETIYANDTRVIPRDCVRRRRFSTSILPYSWAARGI